MSPDWTRIPVNQNSLITSNSGKKFSQGEIQSHIAIPMINQILKKYELRKRKKT